MTCDKPAEHMCNSDIVNMNQPLNSKTMIAFYLGENSAAIGVVSIRPSTAPQTLWAHLAEFETLAQRCYHHRWTVTQKGIHCSMGIRNLHRRNSKPCTALLVLNWKKITLLGFFLLSLFGWWCKLMHHPAVRNLSSRHRIQTRESPSQAPAPPASSSNTHSHHRHRRRLSSLPVNICRREGERSSNCKRPVRFRLVLRRRTAYTENKIDLRNYSLFSANETVS